MIYLKMKMLRNPLSSLARTHARSFNSWIGWSNQTSNLDTADCVKPYCQRPTMAQTLMKRSVEMRRGKTK
jgi:hypothetical protein